MLAERASEQQQYYQQQQQRSRSATPQSAGLSRSAIPAALMAGGGGGGPSRTTSPYTNNTNYGTPRTMSPGGMSDVRSNNSHDVRSNSSHGRPGTTTPTAGSNRHVVSALSKAPMGRNASAVSVGTAGYFTPGSHIEGGESDEGGYFDADESTAHSHTPMNNATAVMNNGTAAVVNTASAIQRASPSTFHPAPSRRTPNQNGPIHIPKDDFGITHMMAIIERSACARKRIDLGLGPDAVVPLTRTKLGALDPVDEMLFGRELDLGRVHEGVRDVFREGFRVVQEADEELDRWLMGAVRGKA